MNTRNDQSNPGPVGTEAEAIDPTLRQAIDRLSRHERIAFTMQAEGKNAEAIAATLKVCRATAHLIASRAARKIKAMLKDSARRAGRRRGY
jgi:DNA-directed RNA polymerase specialized sigma24 family protein